MSRPAAPGRPTLASGREAGAVLALLLVQLALCLHFSRYAPIDDAYIALRYAEHLAGGQGLVFNPGERVEGYTCFLWVLVLAGCAALGVPLEAAARGLGAACLLATLLVTARFRDPHPRHPGWSRLIAPALLATNAASAMWAVHGLETSLFGLLLLLALRADARAAAAGAPSGAAGLWYALAALTRPEGALLFAASLLFRGLALGRGGLAGLGRMLIPFAAIVAPHLLWRRHYYGFLLPNTYYAKVGLSWPLLARGARYVLELFAGPQGLVFLPILLCLPRARADRGVALLLFMACAAGAVVALEGGDAFPAWRFLVPVLPILYLLVQEGTLVAFTAAGLPRATRLAAAGGLLLLAGAVPLHVWRMYQAAMEEARGGDRFTRNMTLAGVALAHHLPPTARIALNPVGALPYHSGLYAYDMLGLTDLHIAHRERPRLGQGVAGHEKGDGAYILDQRPELILFGNVTISPTGPVDLSSVRWTATFTSEQEIARDPRLWRLYAPDQLPLGEGRYLLFLRRRDFRIAPDSVDPRPGSPIFRGGAREGRHP